MISVLITSFSVTFSWGMISMVSSPASVPMISNGLTLSISEAMLGAYPECSDYPQFVGKLDGYKSLGSIAFCQFMSREYDADRAVHKYNPFS